MKLSEKRALFTQLLAQLILWAGTQDRVSVALDQVKRTQAEADANAKSGAGISNSLHLLGLAGDLILYKDGKYMDKSEDYKFLGDYWKSLHPLCRWGGDFKSRPDGNHFSLEHEGVQ